MGGSRYTAARGTNKRKSGGRASGGRTTTRNITRWSANKDVALLCALTKECRRDKYRLSWDRVARWVGPHVTGAAIEQHIAKLYGKLKEWHQAQRPRHKRRKLEEDDPEIDYVEDDDIWSKGNEAFANIFYDKPEHTAGMIDYDNSDAESYTDEFGLKVHRRQTMIESDEEVEHYDNSGNQLMIADRSYNSSHGDDVQGSALAEDGAYIKSGSPAEGTLVSYGYPSQGHRSDLPMHPQEGRRISMAPQGYLPHEGFRNTPTAASSAGSAPNRASPMSQGGHTLSPQMMSGSHAYFHPQLGYPYPQGPQAPQDQAGQYVQSMHGMHPNMTVAAMQHMLRQNVTMHNHPQRAQPRVAVTSAGSGSSIPIKAESHAHDGINEHGGSGESVLPSMGDHSPHVKREGSMGALGYGQNDKGQDGGYFMKPFDEAVTPVSEA